MTPSTLSLPGRRRRELLLSFIGAAALAACGGGEPTPSRGKTSQQAAAGAVAGGVVGAVFASVGPDATRAQASAAGLRQIGSDAAITPEDVLAIGSNTKAMTAMVVAALVERGQVSWDTRIAMALPELQATMRPELATVTLAQLLAHRGGVLAMDGSADDEERFLAAVAADTAPLPQTLVARRRYFAAWLVRQVPRQAVKPGQDFFYSNGGYALAAAMVEALTGQDFEAHFHAFLVQPLALQGQWRMPSEVAAPQPLGHAGARGMVQVHVPDDELRDAEPWLRVLAPAGYWACSTRSYLHWLHWHVLALRGGATPLPVAYVQGLSALAADDYALGWMCMRFKGRPTLVHTGQTAGFTCEAALDQAGAVAVCGLTNTAFTAADGSSWVLGLLDQQVAELLDHALQG